MPQKEHFRHRHPLIVDESCGPVKCFACQKRFKGPVYYCYECRCHLHESCAALPVEIQHFYHSSHSLTLHDIEDDTAVNCHVCQETRPGFTYRCYDCDFKTDVYCAKLQKEIQLSIHPHHPLTLLQFGNIETELPHFFCNFCNNRCYSEQGHRFRCKKCNFKIDLDCARMLLNFEHIQHVSHEHWLTLICGTI